MKHLTKHTLYSGADPGISLGGFLNSDISIILILRAGVEPKNYQGGVLKSINGLKYQVFQSMNKTFSTYMIQNTIN